MVTLGNYDDQIKIWVTYNDYSLERIITNSSPLSVFFIKDDSTLLLGTKYGEINVFDMNDDYNLIETH